MSCKHFLTKTKAKGTVIYYYNKCITIVTRVLTKHTSSDQNQSKLLVAYGQFLKEAQWTCMVTHSTLSNSQYYK